MNDQPIIPGDHDKPEPGLTPDPAPGYREGDVIHTAPEFAVAEADVLAPERGDVIGGTSLWRDAWRRLLRNKLAVFGLVVVALIVLDESRRPTASYLLVVVMNCVGVIPGVVTLVIRLSNHP